MTFSDDKLKVNHKHFVWRVIGMLLNKVCCQRPVSSTPPPVQSACTGGDPDLSNIERDPSVQNTSADSIQTLEQMLYKDCGLTPSMMACARQARMMSTNTGSPNFIPIVGLPLSNTTNDGHSSKEKLRRNRNSSACDCTNIVHASEGNPQDKRSTVERLLSYTARPDINSNDNQKSSEPTCSKSLEQSQQRKTKNKSSVAGFYKKNKSPKSSDSNDSSDHESRKTKTKRDKKNISTKSSELNESDEETKTSKKSLFGNSKQLPDKFKGRHKQEPKAVSTSTEDFGPCKCDSRSTENLLINESKRSNSFLTLNTKHKEKKKSSKQSLAREKKKSKVSGFSSDSDFNSKKEKKSIWKRKKKEKDKKSETKDSSGSSSDSDESGSVDVGTATADLTSVDVATGTCSWNTMDGLLFGKIPISSCPNSPCISARPDPLCKSYPCSPRENPLCFPAPKPCPAKRLPPYTVKPCSRLSKEPCACKSFDSTAFSRTTLDSGAPKPWSCTLLSSPSGSLCPCLIPCPGSSLPCTSKSCPTKSLLKPHDSSPSQSPSPCGSKLFFDGPPCLDTSSPGPQKQSSTESLLKSCARSVSPTCDLSGFKLSSLLPCRFNISSSCAPKLPGDPKPPCTQRSPCDPTLPCASKLRLTKSRPCTPPSNLCESPQNSEETFLNATLSRFSNFLSGPYKTSSPCKSSLKPCSRSQNSSPCRSPTFSDDSTLNKTFPCSAPSAPCTRKSCHSGISPCIAKPCPSKPPGIRNTPCRSKPCNVISPSHTPLSSPDSSCVNICSLKDRCEQETALCKSTFNPIDFLKRCVQFLPSNEDLKPLRPAEVCQGDPVRPTIKKEIDASTDCSRDTEKCTLTQEESCETAGMCEAARAQYYRNKLMSTQQILENKEQTIRIQGESLAVAESRLTTLTIRAGQLRQELECKSKELRMLRGAMSGSCCKGTERTDACTEIDVPLCADHQNHKSVVKTLQTNLSIIEELYRECFYETAKQEALIEKLRQSYLDVRLSDKEKSSEIGRLQNVVNTQKWSLDQCQDIAMEVEGLKMEISNFLNSSNNDSGMWERSEDSCATDVGEDLQHIMDQLLQLKNLLHQEDPLITELSNENCRLKCENTELSSENCRLKCENDELKSENDELKSETCKLKCENDELTSKNCTLKCDNKELEAQIGDYQQKVCKLESTIRNNEVVIDNLERQKECTENELRCAQNQVGALTERVRELESAKHCAQEKISELQSLLDETNQKLEEALKRICHHECTEAELHAQLEESKHLVEENERICAELGTLQQNVRAWSAQLQGSRERVGALRAQLRRALARAATADRSYRQQVEMTTELQHQLEEAHSRGAALCEESRRVVHAVRQGVRDSCAKRREQEEKIKRQQKIIWTLNKELEERQCELEERPPPPAGPCRNVGCTKCTRERERERCGLATCPALHVHSETGVCELASSSSGPVPPRRTVKKKTKACSERCVPRCRSAGAQKPEGARDAATCCAPHAPPAPHPPGCSAARASHRLGLTGCVAPSVTPQPRGQSPSQELLERVENLHDALLCGQRRWGRGADRRS